MLGFCVCDQRLMASKVFAHLFNPHRDIGFLGDQRLMASKVFAHTKTTNYESFEMRDQRLMASKVFAHIVSALVVERKG